MNSPKYSIIIPTYNHLEDCLKPCLESIIKYTDLSDVEVVVVANGCTDGTGSYVNSLGLPFKLVWISEPAGYTKSTNEGIKASKGEYIVLLNNDIILIEQQKNTWLNLLCDPFKDGRVGITGPVKFNFKCGRVQRNAMAFWCVAFRRTLVEEIGYLDEIFSPGMGEDGDFSIKAEIAGYKLLRVPNDVSSEFGKAIEPSSFPIFHLGNGTFADYNEKKNAIIKRNTKILEERYSSEAEIAYYSCLHHPCDINELFPKLRKYASKCETIVEMGTRGVFSVYAFIAAKPNKITCYDIVLSPNIWEADRIAKLTNIDFAFMHRDVLSVEIEETDLLFIDTLHTYKQLKQELAMHSSKVNKYILMHDTNTFGFIGEDGGEGLNKAIDEFLDENKEWTLHERVHDSNGFTVLKRINKKINKKIKCSIVIPSYNHLEDCLRPCIDSIVKYTNMNNIEVITVANGCTDGTKQYLEEMSSKFDWFKYIFVDEPLGYTKATNLGIKKANGKYILLLNNDTEFLAQEKDTWINTLIQPFENNPKMAVVGPLKLFDNYAGTDVIIFFCAMIKKSMFDVLGLLDEEFSPGGGEDVDFCAKAVVAGYEIMSVCSSEYSPEAGTNVGQFPIWHKDNRTFRDIPEYTNKIIKENGLKNALKYNKNIKLNLGSGGVHIDGYLSVDLKDKRTHILMDACKMTFKEDSVSEIIASHLFEHISPYKALDTLVHWKNILKPGGKLIMEMPDIEALCKAFVNATKEQRYGFLNCVYGAVNTTNEGDRSDITSPHLWGWYPEILFDIMSHAGFVDIVFMPEQIPHPGFNFRVEAKKPK